VQFHARYSGTFEGTWLGDSECDALGEVVPFDRQLQARYGVERVVTRLSRKVGMDDVLRDKEWEQFDFSRRRIYTGMTQPTAGCCDYIVADFDGILIIKRNFRMKNGFGNGWGHLGASRFLLVLRSVSNVTPHPCAGTQSTSSPPENPGQDETIPCGGGPIRPGRRSPPTSQHRRSCVHKTSGI